MSDITGISPARHLELRREAERLVAKFDSNGNGAIDASERKQYVGSRQVGLINKHHQDHYHVIDTANFRQADKNHNGKLVAAEMVNFFLEQSDRNGDKRISFGERQDAPYFGGLTDFYQRYQRIEKPAGECHGHRH